MNAAAIRSSASSQSVGRNGSSRESRASGWVSRWGWSISSAAVHPLAHNPPRLVGKSSCGANVTGTVAASSVMPHCSEQYGQCVLVRPDTAVIAGDGLDWLGTRPQADVHLRRGALGPWHMSPMSNAAVQRGKARAPTFPSCCLGESTMSPASDQSASDTYPDTTGKVGKAPIPGHIEHIPSPGLRGGVPPWWWGRLIAVRRYLLACYPGTTGLQPHSRFLGHRARHRQERPHVEHLRADRRCRGTRSRRRGLLYSCPRRRRTGRLLHRNEHVTPRRQAGRVFRRGRPDAASPLWAG